MIKLSNSHQVHITGKLVTPGLLVTVASYKRRTENVLKVHTNTVHASVKKIIPKETPTSLIQCYNCTECNSTFDARHKLKKHTREQHEGKFVKTPQRKSLRTEPKTNIKICNSNKEEFKEQVTAEGEEMKAKIATMDF